MATIDKLNYLNDTKQMIKAELNKLGSEITDETTFRAYVDKIKNIYNDYPKVTGTGTEITLNNTKKGRIDIGLKGNTSQNTLPNEYQAVEYIESTGTQYIDTNFIANQNSSIEIDFKSNYENVSEEYAIFGSFVGEISLALRIYDNTSIKIFRNALTGTQINCNHTLRHKYFVNKNNFYIDNELKETLQQSDFTCLNSIILLAQNSSSSITRAINGRLFNCKIYDNNILVRNYVPCYRKSDNVIGLYDLVNGVFYTNDGTGNFNKGNDVSIPNPNFPLDIRVVKGNNTITIDDGTNSENYSVNLGNIELCKIGDYSDLIFKNEKTNPYYDNTLIENGWYKKQIVNLKTYNGTENFQIGSLSNDNYYIFQTSYGYELANKAPSANDAFSNKFSCNGVESGNVNANKEQIAFNSNAPTYLRFTIGASRLTEKSVQAFQTWLSSNNVLIYYVLANPVNIQITDTTLINQLEAIYNAQSFDDTTIITQTNADLPFNLTASALMKGSV